MPSLKLPEDVLGPAEGALSRTMFPTPTPGAVVPYVADDVSLEELDKQWREAIAAATAARKARAARN